MRLHLVNLNYLSIGGIIAYLSIYKSFYNLFFINLNKKFIIIIYIIGVLMLYFDTAVVYKISSIISFIIGTVLNYYLCTFWIFKIRVVENRYYEFLYYALITAIGLGINTLLIWGFTEFFGFHYMLSKLLSAFVTYWWNFGARKYFLHTIK